MIVAKKDEKYDQLNSENGKLKKQIEKLNKEIKFNIKLN